MKREWSARKIYLYLVSLITLIMVIVGSVQLIRAGVAFIYPPPVYYPSPAEIKMRGDATQIPAEEAAEQARLERARQEQQMKYDRGRRLGESLGLIVVALPVYLYHWKRIRCLEDGHNDAGPGPVQPAV